MATKREKVLETGLQEALTDFRTLHRLVAEYRVRKYLEACITVAECYLADGVTEGESK